MEKQTKSQQRKLNNELQAIKIMLANKRKTAPASEWINIVELTKQSILSNPRQYFDSELPDRQHLNVMIENIFQRFIDDQSIR